MVRKSRPGIIPAHAGLTATRTVRCSRSRDHPRACGAHYNDEILMGSNSGSSPRMRGSPKSSSQTHLRTGIIPAHAGLTIMCILIPIQLRDHPRACGAHDQFTIKLISAMGSSPRMRGSRLARRQSSAAQGIIPAHAGLTLDTPDRFYRARDHPRACGAHIERYFSS